MLRSVVNLSLAALLLSACGSGEPDPRPASQIAFTAAVAQYAEEYRAANDLRRPEIRAARKDAVLAAAPGGEVVNWIGVVKQVRKADGGGALDIQVEGAPCTLRNIDGFSFAPGTPAHELLQVLREKERIVFSGMFISDEKDGARELSITTFGGMTEPEYAFVPVVVDRKGYSPQDVKAALAEARADWEAAKAESEAAAAQKKENLAKALAAIKAEPEVKDAAWNSESLPSLLAGVINDGTRQDGYAQYLCLVLYRHGIKGGVVRVMDAGAATYRNEWVELGKAWCPKE